MHSIKDIFKNDESYQNIGGARQDRRQPKYRLFPPGARLVRI